MSQTKLRKPSKRQLGQFITPSALACLLIESLEVDTGMKVLEPSFGDGAFILPLIEKFLPLYDGPIERRLDLILNDNIYGIELDRTVYQQCLDRIVARWGYLPTHHNLVHNDFFRHDFTSADLRSSVRFALIIGNPPFGGTFDPKIENELDRRYGIRYGEKIKKETYAFFIVRSLDMLSDDGHLKFICSDTFLTIKTMRGLRRFLMEHACVSIESLGLFSNETSYPMVVLDAKKNGRAHSISVDGQPVHRSTMEMTGNFSWSIDSDHVPYFAGPKLGEFFICSSGMTIGKNELFVRNIEDSEIEEPLEFEYFEEPITLGREIERARLHFLSDRAREKIILQERRGVTRRNVRIVPREISIRIKLPHPDYRYYNKAQGGIIYAPPRYVVYWKDGGDAVLTFKKNGNWYLHGVGGQRFFGRSGLTWQLIASRLNVRYLPEGYILDSGAPCAFLRDGVAEDELFFVLAWTSTAKCTDLLKTVINHTQNIQSKDFERLPYPFWVSEAEKLRAIRSARALLQEAMNGRSVQRSDPRIQEFESIFALRDMTTPRIPARVVQNGQMSLW